MNKLIKVETCEDCENSKGVRVSFFGGLPVICSCIMKQISVDGKQSIYNYIKEHTAGYKPSEI